MSYDPNLHSSDALQPLDPDLHNTVQRLIDGRLSERGSPACVIVMYAGNGQYAMRANLDDLNDAVALIQAAVKAIRSPGPLQ